GGDGGEGRFLGPHVLHIGEDEQEEGQGESQRHRSTLAPPNRSVARFGAHILRASACAIYGSKSCMFIEARLNVTGNPIAMDAVSAGGTYSGATAILGAIIPEPFSGDTGKMIVLRLRGFLGSIRQTRLRRTPSPFACVFTLFTFSSSDPGSALPKIVPISPIIVASVWLSSRLVGDGRGQGRPTQVCSVFDPSNPRPDRGTAGTLQPICGYSNARGVVAAGPFLPTKVTGTAYLHIDRGRGASADLSLMKLRAAVLASSALAPRTAGSGSSASPADKKQSGDSGSSSAASAAAGPVVEAAPFQKLFKQKPKKDVRTGTIEKDADYRAFCAALQAPAPPLPSADVQADIRESEGKEEPKPQNALLDFLKERGAKRVRDSQRAAALGSSASSSRGSGGSRRSSSSSAGGSAGSGTTASATAAAAAAAAGAQSSAATAG
ncbi:unnamed protein product, partial [Scytosiphon promiscuus]